MRRPFLALCALLVISLQMIQAQTPARRAVGSQSTSPDMLPVRRVILYKNGIGYFEHLGKVRGNQNVGIDFNTSQLNDVLKTLTVLDLGNGRVTGVSYNSEAPPARRARDDGRAARRAAWRTPGGPRRRARHPRPAARSRTTKPYAQW